MTPEGNMDYAFIGKRIAGKSPGGCINLAMGTTDYAWDFIGGWNCIQTDADEEDSEPQHGAVLVSGRSRSTFFMRGKIGSDEPD
jgi:hypothetical protein